MSHFLDRLNYFAQPREGFARLGKIGQSIEEMAHGFFT